MGALLLYPELALGRVFSCGPSTQLLIARKSDSAQSSREASRGTLQENGSALAGEPSDAIGVGGSCLAAGSRLRSSIRCIPRGAVMACALPHPLVKRRIGSW